MLCDYTGKQELKKLLFPDGMVYHPQKDKVQTKGINPILELVSCMSKELSENKNGQFSTTGKLSAFVTTKGFEPPTLRAEI